jgi:hypothetical protein
MPEPIAPSPRTVVIVWRDCDGNEVREQRIVHFVKGYGSYVRWNRRHLFVEPLQEELRVNGVGPKLRRPV